MPRTKYYLLCAGLMLGACGDSTGPSERVPGSYTLQSVNGQALPFQIASVLGVYTLVWTGGTMTLNENFTFLERDILKETLQNDATHSTVTVDTTIITGRWALQDSVITLTDDGTSDVLFGVARNSRLTLTFTSGDSAYTMRYMHN